jgi:hypothetical protein
MQTGCFTQCNVKLCCVMQGGGATSTGPAAGDGHEIMLQGFNWESYKHDWYKTLKEQAKRIAEVSGRRRMLLSSNHQTSMQCLSPNTSGSVIAIRS